MAAHWVAVFGFWLHVASAIVVLGQEGGVVVLAFFSEERKTWGRRRR
jgi:hypothetical protein